MRLFAGSAALHAVAIMFTSLSLAATQIRTDESRHGSQISYLAEPSEKGKLILDANNGFFNKGAFRAEGKHTVPQSDQELISSHFTHLVSSGGEVAGEARWHLWCPTPGRVELKLDFNVPAQEAGQSWQLQLGDQQHVIQLSASEAGELQESPIGFSIETPGKHTLILRHAKGPVAKTSIHAIHLIGKPIEDASLLRARWRPAAIHTQYHSSSCPTTMWVFESRSDTDMPSYSPITTRFGYYGGSFTADRTAKGNMNFSMWAASRNAKSAPPLDQMPHLLATGNPQAEFSGFGHEGSGVKIRNWDPLSHHPESIIQALRVERADGYDTYSGYFFDERIDRWVLFATGRKPVQVRRGGEEPATLRCSSFCEVPGPPAIERTGDQLRQIRRRGWFYGKGQQWHPVDRQTTRVKADALPTNKMIGADDGWFTMATGGIEMFEISPEVKLTHVSKELPAYLSPGHTAQLFEMPVEFGPSTATHVSCDSAVIKYDLKKAGPNAKATLHYGPVDCLAFVERELHGTERRGVSSSFLSNERTWASAIKPQPVRNGDNEFSLNDLEPSTQYYYRLFVVNDAGKSWDVRSGTFTTR